MKKEREEEEEEKEAEKVELPPPLLLLMDIICYKLRLRNCSQILNRPRAERRRRKTGLIERQRERFQRKCLNVKPHVCVMSRKLCVCVCVGCKCSCT